MNEARVPASLEDAKVRNLPNTAYYLPEFITKDEEDILIERVSRSP